MKYPFNKPGDLSVALAWLPAFYYARRAPAPRHATPRLEGFLRQDIRSEWRKKQKK